MDIFSIVLLMAILYCIYRIVTLHKENGRNKKILQVLSHFNDKEAFEQELNAQFTPENSAEYTARLQALRVWGGTYHDDEQMFREGLENLDLNALLNKEDKRSAVGINESTFFWLLLFVPNNLYSKSRFDQMDMVFDKISTIKDYLENEMVWQLGLANRKFYKHEEDRGMAFYEQIMEGNYEGMHYSKELISSYKHMIACMQASLYQESGDSEKFEELLPVLEEFQKVPLGKRWMSELGIELPEEKPEEDETEPVEETEE